MGAISAHTGETQGDAFNSCSSMVHRASLSTQEDWDELEVSQPRFKPPGGTVQETSVNKVALMLGSTTIKQTWKETQTAVKTVCFSLKTEWLGDWSGVKPLPRIPK